MKKIMGGLKRWILEEKKKIEKRDIHGYLGIALPFTIL